MNKWKRCGLSLIWLCALPVTVQAYEECGSLNNGFGPYDYRRITPEHKDLVERAHFTNYVERLQRGNTVSRPGPDIDYTLRAIPNHPRALRSMMRLAERERTDRPAGSKWSMACWFDRAIRFQPDDGAVRMLYASYLAKGNKPKEALEQLELASELLGENDGNAQYNMGLMYVDLKMYDKALVHAHRAYALGFDLPGLRNQLQRAGKWKPLPPDAKPVIATTPAAPDSKPADPAPIPAMPPLDATLIAPPDAQPGKVGP